MAIGHRTGLAIKRFDSRPAVPLSRTTLGKLFTHVRLPIIKQDNFVLVKGRRCCAAGKVTAAVTEVITVWPVA